MQFWNSLPNWARGVIIVTILLVLIYLGWQFKDFLNQAPGEKEEKAKGNPVKTPQQAKVELAKMKALKDPRFTPTYSETQFKSFADQLFEAMNNTGSNSSVIKNIFSKLYKTADVYALINAYGVRQLKVLGLADGGPGNLSQHLVSEGETDSANKGLEKNKVYFSF